MIEEVFDNPHDENTPQWLLWEKESKYRIDAKRCAEEAVSALAKADMYKAALERVLGGGG